MSFRELGDRYLAYLGSSRAYAPASLRKYAASVKALCRLLGEETDAEALSRPDVAKFRDRLLSLPASWQNRSGDPTAAKPGERQLSSRTVDRVLMDLRRMYRWGISEAQLARRDNPFEGIGVARVAVNHKRAPSPEEAERLMELPRPRAIDALTWRTMPALGRYTGCRAGELAQLRAEDVVTRQGILCLAITAEGDDRRLKTASSKRLVPVLDKLAPHLQELLARRPEGRLVEAGDFVGKDGTVKGAHAFLRHYNRRAKKVAEDLSFHCWRVYANDAMATASVDIGDRERLLGHKSTRTQTAYTPENLRRLKAAVDAIP
jgi:integrase